MPHRIPRYAARFIRAHLLGVLITLIAAESVLLGYGFYRYAQITNKIVDVQIVNCQTGNVARTQIRFVTKVLRDLVDVSLAIPPDRNLTTREIVARSKLIQTFAAASQRLSKHLPALAPRSCDRAAVIDGNPVVPK